MSTPPMRTGEPGFRPDTSWKAALNLTWDSHTWRFWPMRNTAMLMSTSAAVTKRPTFASRFMGLRRSVSLGEGERRVGGRRDSRRREERGDVFSLGSAPLDEITNVGFL